jgi:hypothetical protein
MKKRFPVVLLLFIVACDRPIDRKIANKKNADTSNTPNIAYSLINARTDNGGQFYDIYLKDTAKIKTLNSYLKEKYGSVSGGWIQINYFSDSIVAKSYFDKQFDNNVSDKEKDKLSRVYIANYKYNPTTKYDSLVFQH